MRNKYCRFRGVASAEPAPDASGRGLEVPFGRTRIATKAKLFKRPMNTDHWCVELPIRDEFVVHRARCLRGLDRVQKRFEVFCRNEVRGGRHGSLDLEC